MEDKKNTEHSKKGSSVEQAPNSLFNKETIHISINRLLTIYLLLTNKMKSAQNLGFKWTFLVGIIIRNDRVLWQFK